MGKSKFAGMFDEENEKTVVAVRTERTATVGRPRQGKRSDPDYGLHSIYLRDLNVMKARRILEDKYGVKKNKKDLSTLLDELLAGYIAEHQEP